MMTLFDPAPYEVPVTYTQPLEVLPWGFDINERQDCGHRSETPLVTLQGRCVTSFRCPVCSYTWTLDSSD